MPLALAQGFDDPVAQSQAAFRAAMNALATPGRLIPYRAGLGEATPLAPNAAALGLALLDFEVGFHLVPGFENEAAILDYFCFHTGAKPCAAKDAAFAFLDLARARPNLGGFAQGEPDYPDRSTTIILIPTLGAPDQSFRIAGPGISGEATVGIWGLPADFSRQWAENTAQFPLGVDLLFALPDGLMGLPRSTRIIGEAR